MKKTVLAGALIALLSPLTAFAFTPQWVSESPVALSDVTTAHAYFSVLVGEPHSYTFELSKPTRVFFTILIPDVARAKKDVNVAIVETRDPTIPLGVLLSSGTWTPFPYEGNQYLRGEAYRATLPPGSYQILVWSSNNDSAYALVVGENEPFILSKVIGAYRSFREINAMFFGKGALSALSAPLIYWPLVMVLAALALALSFTRRRRDHHSD